MRVDLFKNHPAGVTGEDTVNVVLSPTDARILADILEVALVNGEQPSLDYMVGQIRELCPVRSCEQEPVIDDTERTYRADGSEMDPFETE